MRCRPNAARAVLRVVCVLRGQCCYVPRNKARNVPLPVTRHVDERPIDHLRSLAERLDAVFARMRKERMEAFLLPDINLQPQLLVELATKYRIPTIHSLPDAVTDWGGLAAYSTSSPDELGKVVDYAIRIVKGGSPRELPVQEPTQYELILNARAAREMGLSLPPTFRMRATTVLEK